MVVLRGSRRRLVVEGIVAVTRSASLMGGR
jgi:hypothetical protein